MSEVEKLEPCPFCGGPAYRTESVNGTSMLHVGCAPCGVDLKAALVPDYSAGRGPGHLGWSKDVVALWNRRAALQPQARRVEELEAFVRDVEDGLTWNSSVVQSFDRIATVVRDFKARSADAAKPSPRQDDLCPDCGLDWCGVTCGRWPKGAVDV